MNGIWNKNTLIAALAIQVAVVAALIAVRSGGTVEPEPFLEFDAAAVDALSVSGDQGEVALAKQDDAWQLSDGLPADGAKVDDVIEKLADAAGGWPVATSASVHERFELTEDSHQRRVKLSAGGDTVADIYLGTSPGYRKTHARRADDDNIYAITFSNYEAGMKDADWLDKSLLRPDGALTGLRYHGAMAESATPLFALTKNEEGMWAAASGTALDQAKVETLAGRFTGLTVTGVSETTPDEVLAAVPADEETPDAEAAAAADAAGVDDAAADDVAADDVAATEVAAATDVAGEEPKTPAKMVFALADDAGAATLTVRRVDDNDYVAVSDRLPGVYKLSSYIAEQMHQTLADLAPDEPEAPPDATDAASNEDETLGDDDPEAAPVEAVAEPAPQPPPEP